MGGSNLHKVLFFPLHCRSGFGLRGPPTILQVCTYAALFTNYLALFVVISVIKFFPVDRGPSILLGVCRES